MDDQILSLEHISLSYHTMKGETPALCDLTFSVTPGEFVALVGPSGCGKSTILNLISGLLKPEAGTLLSRGRPITEADLHIGYMLQRDHLFEWRTIYSNVLLGLEISRTLTPERKEKVGEMMETYGLKSFSNARPSELSGGMRQRTPRGSRQKDCRTKSFCSTPSRVTLWWRWCRAGRWALRSGRWRQCSITKS